ncbi:MAG: nucleotidyl transferase AbiEii/AbiGii toxin family protein [Clostridia bacterium]
MRYIAKSKESDLIDLFKNTASKLGMNEVIIEKDFWVCWMLDFLFHRSEFKDVIAFKGGTSLSKSYGLIDRFSEDIDIILDWQVLGYSKNEPWEKRTNTAQDVFNKEANIKTEKYLNKIFMPSIQEAVKNELGYDVVFSVDIKEPQTIIFEYRKSFNDKYILPIIRLEVGALAAWTPTEKKAISPYVAQVYEQLFEQKQTEVLTVKPERTFWEKATILHREANRQNGNLPSRYSRHYYDLYRLSESIYKNSAINDKDLLKKVVEFKDKFYHCKWAKYEDCLNGNFKLVPSDEILKKVSNDYKNMQNMLFGEKPTMDEIIENLKMLEKEINME